MARIVKCGLIQATHAGPTDAPIEDIKRANIDKHLGFIEQAAQQGVQILCMQEVFTTPYFCAEQNPHWYGLVERIPDGPTTKLMQEIAKQHQMVIVAPIYEEEMAGVYYNTAAVIDADGTYLGKYRKTHIPCGQNDRGSFHETFYYGSSDGNLGVHRANIARNPFFPVFQTSIGNVGVAICYDRHFEGVVHSLKEGGAELVFCPAITFGKKSQKVWHQEFLVDAVRHGVFIGGSNRLGSEPPWTIEYFGESYFCGPQGLCPVIASPTGLVMSDLDLTELTEPDPSGWNLPRDIRYDIYSPRITRTP